MPFIRITLGAELSPDKRNTLARRATDLIVDILGKRREVTAVLVETAANASWLIGGQPAPLSPCHCEIAITAGSNTPAEIARMIAATSALLREALGSTPDASYVVIRELPAGNWGYDGHTQAARRQGGAL